MVPIVGAGCLLSAADRAALDNAGSGGGSGVLRPAQAQGAAAAAAVHVHDRTGRNDLARAHFTATAALLPGYLF